MKAGYLKTLLGGFCLLLVCATVSAKAAKAHGESKKARGCGGTGGSKDRIVGGRDAGIGEFPYQVALRQRGRYFCGGSIISESWILTAAQCVFNNPDSSRIDVVVGANTLNSGSDGDGAFYYVVQMIYHPLYDQDSTANDIAVVRVQTQIVMSDTVAPVALSTSDPPAGSTATVTGWGLTSYPTGNPSETLQAINLDIIALEQCQEVSPNPQVHSNNVCTLGTAGKGICQGDSGGPLAINGTQVGIASWGIPCAQGYPDVFSSVAYYRSWIKSSTGV